MAVFILLIFYHFMLTSEAHFLQSAIQVVETSVRNIDELKLLSASSINSSSLSPSCITDAFLTKNKNKTVRNVVFTDVTIENVKIQAAERNSSLAKIELNITFPVTQTEEEFTEIISNALIMKIKLFVVKNSTKDLCNTMQCPKDPICSTKMDEDTTNQNIMQWELAQKASENTTCQYSIPKGKAPVHEGIGKMQVINAALKLEKAALNATFDCHKWSSSLPEAFFKGFESANMTMAGITLSIVYSYDMKEEVNWFFTTEGTVNLVLMGILGFNILAIMIALLFCACNRSKRAFDMEVWEYAFSRKNEENSEEF